jgi:M6 family metalloprotease-like protein
MQDRNLLTINSADSKSTLKILSIFLAILFMQSTFISQANAAPAKQGQVCKKINQQIISSGKTLICKKKGGKLTWTVKNLKPVIESVALPPAPVVVANKLPIYTFAPGGSSLAKSFELPVSVVTAPETANLKLWIYHPGDPNKSLGSSGIWIKPSAGSWSFIRTTTSDGSFFTQLTPGDYQFDTVEPDTDRASFSRITHFLNIDSTGKASIKGLAPNSKGYFTVTVIQKSTLTSTFKPTTRCQLLDLGVNTGMNSGFPKHPDRLTSNGVIQALILPIDFDIQVGKGDPAEVFYGMATGMDLYFKSMSDNRVSFDYQILPNWHRANFDPTKFKMGAWGAGDPSGYYTAALASADSIVDYSKFDVVYVLSPKEISFSLIAYGPAFPVRWATDDGPVKNGTISGADAYQSNDKFAWSWMAHETGHLFGMHDLYTVPPNANVYGDWDLMSNNFGRTLELNAWNRYTQGWLTDSQITCLDSPQLTTPIDVLLNPLSQTGAKTKAIAIRLSDKEILVAEVRRKSMFDDITKDEEGLLVYKVDLSVESIKGGWQVQRRPKSFFPNFLDALLKPGDKIRVGSVQIEVLSTSQNGDLVRISN